MERELKNRLDSLNTALEEVLHVQISTGLTLLHIILGITPEKEADIEMLKIYCKTIIPILLKHKEMIEIKVLLQQARDIIKKKQTGES